jgi:hypothetical protein
MRASALVASRPPGKAIEPPRRGYELEVRGKTTSISAGADSGTRRFFSAAPSGVQRMLSPSDSLCRIPQCFLPIAALLWAVACTPSREPAPSDAPQGEVRSFEGSWSAAGTKRTLELGPGHEAAVFDLTGSVVLSGEHRPAVGFQARVIGFSDDRATMLGRSVWTDERGDQVYSDLTGNTEVTGNRIFGTIRGGTGRYAGVTGDYSFEWKYMLESEDGAVSGRADDLKGQIR